jgi:pimeloyl-ACP methyl ester carboxylesterase
VRVYFKDELFDGQLLRALTAVYYGGAEVGECLSTAQRIAEGNAESWYQAWQQTADRVYAAAEASLARGYLVSAREAFLRAATYYRTAYLFLIGAPVDPRLVQAYDRQTDAFQRAGTLFSPPFEPISIAYGQATLPGYFFRVDDSSRPRPTLILTGGYDSTAEELYTYSAAAALRRGYNCLSFDGPGQGAALIKQGLVFRPDWENVIRPVVDHLLARPEVDPQRIVLMGASFGGYLAPRAASGEHRLAACIADPGEFDLFRAIQDRLPAFLARQLPKGNRLALEAVKVILNRVVRQPTRGWSMRRGMWVHGVSTPLDYVRLSQAYTLRGYAEQIRCPTLVCYADHDEVAAYARQLFDALTGPKDFIAFTQAEGAGEHCESGNRALFHQRVFDWLDQLGMAPATDRPPHPEPS